MGGFWFLFVLAFGSIALLVFESHRLQSQIDQIVAALNDLSEPFEALAHQLDLLRQELEEASPEGPASKRSEHDGG